MALPLGTRLFLVALGLLLAAPAAAHAQITGGPLLDLPGRMGRNNLAYDSVNQVYLAIVSSRPVTGRFLNKNGVSITGDFVISQEPGDPFVGWVSIAFGGPAGDPTFLVTYVLADDVQNPKFARFVRFNGGAPTVSGAIHIADTTTAWFASEKAQTVWNGQRFVIGSRAQPPGWSFATPQLNLLDMAGNLTPPLFLGDNLDLYGAPAVACAPNGVCLVIGFMAGIPTGYSGGTYARRFDYTSMAPLGGLFFLATNNPNEDQGVVYQEHTGRFLAQWYRGGGVGYIDTRLIGTDGWLSTLDLGRGIGPNAGTNAIAYNPATQSSLLVTKRTGQQLVVMELGDDGYPVNPTNTVVVTNWDGTTPDYWPSLAVNAADEQWLVSANLSAGMVGRLIQGGGPGDIVRNGTFDAGMTHWTVFSQPTPTDLVTSITNGVLHFYRQPLPPGTAGQGVIMQPLGVGLPANVPVRATFDLGNSSSVRKRITVLLHDSDFSDLQMCTFWLAPGTALRPYRISSHTMTVWDNATLSFYAATTGSDGGAYMLDNVHAYSIPGEPTDRTECADPSTPGPQSFPDSNTLLANGNFQGGLAPWAVFGQITHQITGGVFQFVRPAGTPAGVVLQATGLGLPLHTRMTATLSLGNSSGVRKRVTVLVHDNDFSDLAACTFWLNPGQALSSYTMKLYSSRAWTNATFSVYPSTVDTAQWIRFDNASLRVTLSTPMVGTECIEPGGSENVPGESGFTGGGWPAAATQGERLPEGRRAVWTAEALGTDAQLLMLTAPIDLRHATSAVLRFDSMRPDGAAEAFIEATRDGRTWERVAIVPPSDDWSTVVVDLREFLGDVIYVRFAYAGTAADGLPLEAWSVSGVAIDAARPRVFQRPAR
jgi:hypothetical protein